MKTEKPLLHLICGLPGSGKTTLAKRLETSHAAFRFCPDEWIRDIWPGATPDAEGTQYRDQIEQLQWKLGKRLLKIGQDVTIEWGTWGKDERLTLRDEAWEIGAEVKFYYLDVPRAILRERILARNLNLGPHDFLLPEDELDAQLDTWFQTIQVPQKDELDSYDYLG